MCPRRFNGGARKASAIGIGAIFLLVFVATNNTCAINIYFTYFYLRVEVEVNQFSRLSIWLGQPLLVGSFASHVKESE